MYHKNSVDILIINYKSHEILKQCLNSICEENLNYKIHILNNDSTVKLKDKLESLNLKNIYIYESEVNLGFAAGMNYLVEHAVKSDFFFLLNPDAILSKNVIFSLLEEMSRNDSVAVISPLIYDINHNIWFNYGKIDWQKNKIINVKQKTNKQVYEIDVFNGCAALIRTSAFKKANGFDENLFMYYDEAFLSLRLRNIGYKLLLKSNTYLIHNVSYSTRDNQSFKIFYITRNGFAFFLKNNRKKFLVVNRFLINGLYYIKHFSLINFLSYYKGIIHAPRLLKRIK